MKKFTNSHDFITYILFLSDPRCFFYIDRNGQQLQDYSYRATLLSFTTELMIRTALMLLLAVMIESILGDTIYESYRLDHLFSAFVAIGVVNSCSFYLSHIFLRRGFNHRTVFLRHTSLRNTTYALLAGFFLASPVLIMNWKNNEAPFDNGLYFETYVVITIILIISGLVLAYRNKDTGKLKLN